MFLSLTIIVSSTFCSKGKSFSYNQANQEFEQKLKNEAKKYQTRIVNEVKDGKRGSGYSAIRKLGDGPNQWDKKKEFSIPAYVEQGLTPEEAANKLAEHFAAISQTVEPLEEKNFHPMLREAIEEGRKSQNKPVITQHDVYRKLLKIKKPNSSVPGDIPRVLVKEYPFLWAGPAAKMFNRIFQASEWPAQWKVENAICLHKTADPSQVQDENDTRTISKTKFLSKVLENLLGDWLLPLVDEYLDPGQCGGLKNTSIQHYLIKLLDFIHKGLDQRTPHAVVVAALDLSKAYNRGNHQLVIEDLHNMHVPSWILALLCSYLSSRSIVVKYQDTEAAPRQLPGGFGAGTWLGGFLFIVKFNGICMRPPIPRQLTGNSAMQVKYIDDSTKAATINLKSSLIQDPAVRPFPLNINERTQMIINPSENIMQDELNKFYNEVTSNKLVVNEKKTQIMVCNPSRKLVFPPEFTIGPSEVLEVKSTLKILGIQVQHDLKWNAQVEQMTKKASSKIWMLRRMKQLGVDENTICHYWKAEGRVHLEAASAVWGSGLTVRQAQDLQRVEHRAVAAFTSWREDPALSCLRLGLQPLAARRLKLAKTFAKRTVEKSRHKDIFTRIENPYPGRGGVRREWREPQCRTKRHLQSAVPFLTRLLNGQDS